MAREARRSLDGTVVAILGGAGGIGRATATALAARGARVAIGDLDGELALATGKSVVRELAEEPAQMIEPEAEPEPEPEPVAAPTGAVGAVRVTGASVDVTSRPSLERFLDGVERDLGPLEVLVNCAGIMPLAPLADETDASTRWVVEVNLIGALLAAGQASTRFTPRGRGELVNIAGVAGWPHVGGMGGGVSFAATQQAVVGMSEALRSELRGSGVSVRLIVTALVETEMAAGIRHPRWMAPVAPATVAAAVVDALELGLDELHVPAGLGRALRLAALLPSWLRRLLGRALRTEHLLAAPDPVPRAAYEARVTPPSARDRAATVASAAASVADAIHSHDGSSGHDGRTQQD